MVLEGGGGVAGVRAGISSVGIGNHPAPSICRAMIVGDGTGELLVPSGTVSKTDESECNDE